MFPSADQSIMFLESVPMTSEDFENSVQVIWATFIEVFWQPSPLSLSLYRNKQLGHCAKRLLLCFTEESHLGLEQHESE